MADISKINQFLDSYLDKKHLESLSAVEANEILTRAGLLSDSPERPGKPLRDLLRKGGFPHAYQLNGRFWVIPHSKGRNEVKIIQQPNKNISMKKGSIDLTELSGKLLKAREQYKPKVVKCLLIAEAAPDSVERFFYYEDVKKADFLFLGIIEVLYPELKEEYLRLQRENKLKVEILNKLKEDGFYLLDLFPVSISHYSGSIDEAASLLLNEIKDIIINETPIILIKANVYDTLYDKLISNGYKKVSKERLPFPSTGGQIKFQEGFIRALKELHLN